MPSIMLGADTSRIGAAVLTNPEAFGTFPPRGFAPLFPSKCLTCRIGFAEDSKHVLGII
jgi:hypothetical protein